LCIWSQETLTVFVATASSSRTASHLLYCVMCNLHFYAHFWTSLHVI
jgi:hypothetical protein